MFSMMQSMEEGCQESQSGRAVNIEYSTHHGYCRSILNTITRKRSKGRGYNTYIYHQRDAELYISPVRVGGAEIYICIAKGAETSYHSQVPTVTPVLCNHCLDKSTAVF